MLVSCNRGVVQTLPRSFSEIEVDFARSRKGNCRRSQKSFDSKQRDFYDNSEVYTDVSSIIDLRNKATLDQRRSRSLDTLDESLDYIVRRKEIHSSNRRSLNVRQRAAVQNADIKCRRRISFHSSLRDLPNNNSNIRGSHRTLRNAYIVDSAENYETTRVNRHKSDQDERRDFKTERRSLQRRTDPDGQVFLQATSKDNSGKSGSNRSHTKPATLPGSPTGPFKSTLGLLRSSEKKRGLRQQVVVTISCSLAPFACGFAIAYTLIKNPQNLIKPDGGFWGQYIFTLAAIGGSFISGVASNHGRKMPLFLCMVVLMLGWIAVIFSTKTWMVLLFHGLCGACSSIAIVLSQIYIAEIAVPNMRGALSCSPLLAAHIGLLACFLLGDTMTWKNLAIAGVSIIAPFFVAVALCMPESPRYLIQNRPDEALTVLQWLRGFSSNVMEEYRDISDNYNVDKWSIDRHDVFSPSFWRPVVVSCALMFLYNMTGIASMVMYGDELLKEMSFTYPNASYIILTAVTIVGILISVLLVDRVGRKLLLLLSITIMAASSFTLGLFLFLKDIHKVKTYFIYQWAAEIFSIILFSLAHSSAVAPISWITLGEVFGPRLKWVGVTMSSMFMWGSMIVVELAYHKISFAIATGGLFWFHCIICVGGYIFLLLLFRELKDRKLDETDKVFLRKSDDLLDTFITKI